MSTTTDTDPSQATSILEEGPRLPLEIELIPLLYDVITIYPGSSQYRYPPSTLLEKYGHHTHHICFRNAKSSALLPFCPNAHNVAFWFNSSPSPDLLNLPVKRLTLDDFGFLTSRLERDPDDIQLAQWCSNITHLTVADGFTEEDSRYLTHFPALEYLMTLESGDDEGIREILKCFPQLKVVVRLLGPVSDDEKTQVVRDSQLEGLYQDIRVVKMDALFMADWVRGAQGLGDVFDVAEREVEARRGALIMGSR
ncbi:hypothetical protein BDN72DRAFT_840343 [Pluteus cervinus]|uniref:Uncharacterized protein n=1 Tax=Pluteus cervinus TaxID=181527 RepID=A0ACD3AU54_9AGAR|nr:hypothetical protein BDN72DRAFT_840343 [Pluteus cervinus]